MTIMLSKERLGRLAYLGVAMLTFIFLAAGISSVRPQAGEIVFAPLEERLIEDVDHEVTTVTTREVNPGSPIGFLVLLVIVAVAIYGAYHSKRVRYGFFFLFIFSSFLFGAILAYRLLYARPNENSQESEYFRQIPERPPEELFNNPPDWLDSVSLAVTAGLLVLIAAGIYMAIRIRRTRKPPLEVVAREAETTLADIRAGVEVKDAVLRCYLDMTQALIRQRGLVREEGMTPREFEEVLISERLPPESVQRLTRLFEGVRYGGQEASEEDKQEALAALEEIVAAIRRPKIDQPSASTAVNAYA